MCDEPPYLRPYRQAVERHGAGFEATLWLSKRGQRTRFAVIADMVDLRDLRVLDAGCGNGDLCEFLHDHGVRFERYIGIDGMAEMIQQARARRLPRAVFECGDFVADANLLRLGDPDVIVFSGSLNTMDEAVARGVVGRAWQAARRGVAFNFLSNRYPDAIHGEQGPARRFDTIAWIDWALDHTANVRFRHDYLQGHDATITMMR